MPPGHRPTGFAGVPNAHGKAGCAARPLKSAINLCVCRRMATEKTILLPLDFVIVMVITRLMPCRLEIVMVNG